MGVPAIEALLEVMDGYFPEPVRDTDKPFLMPVEDVFRISGRGTVATGRVERGMVTVGDEVELVGIRPTSKMVVEGVEMFRKRLDQGQAGDNLGLLFQGVEPVEVERGQVLAKPGSIRPHQKFTCEAYALSPEEGGRQSPPSFGDRHQFYFRTIEITGVVAPPGGAEAPAAGDIGLLYVELQTPIAMEEGLRFAIREDGRTVGAGVVWEIVE